MSEMLADEMVFDFSNGDLVEDGGLVEDLITDEVVIKAPPKFVQSPRISAGITCNVRTI